MDKKVAIILSGGNSTRFGKAKPFLKLDNGSTFIEYLVSTYKQFGCDEIILVLNNGLREEFAHTLPEAFRSEIRIVYNSNADLGRFYSLKLGANTVSNCDYCFIQNIDNPFTDLETLQKLYAKRTPHAFISPVYEVKGGHPVLVPRMIIDMIRKETNITFNIKDFLNQFKKIAVNIENDKILANINTPDDYDAMIPIKN